MGCPTLLGRGGDDQVLHALPVHVAEGHRRAGWVLGGHSIIFSASSCIESGIVTPIARAIGKLTMRLNLVARSTGRSAVFAPFNIYLILAARAAVWALSARIPAKGLVGLFSKTALDRPGKQSFKISRCLPVKSVNIGEIPVRFPPGCARLSTICRATGSEETENTTGIVVVAFLAASTAAVVPVKITSTLAAMRSATSASNRDHGVGQQIGSQVQYSFLLYIQRHQPLSECA